MYPLEFKSNFCFSKLFINFYINQRVIFHLSREYYFLCKLSKPFGTEKQTGDFMEKVKNLIVGCGLSGVVMAERLASKLKEPVLIIDRRNHIGGNIYDYKDAGITVHKYGPHAFHTNIERVWLYVNQFTKFYPFNLKVTAYIDGKCVPIPFNLNSIEALFPKFMAERFERKLIERFGYNVKVPILNLKKETDEDLSFLAEFVYKNVFEGYTLKQWGLKPEEIDPAVMARVPVFVGRDNRYFQDKYQGIPWNGYTHMIENMLNNQLIDVRLNTNYQDIKNSVNADRVFFTGSIDEYFDYCEGELPYRSLFFDVLEKNIEYEQASATLNYPTNYDWTRVCEHKHFLNEHTKTTILSFEYPLNFENGKNERYYPIANANNLALFNKYLEKAKNLRNVYFLGRLGDYKYYNMDQCVARALDLFERIK